MSKMEAQKTPKTVKQSEATVPQLANFFIQSYKDGKYALAFQVGCECVLRDPENPIHMLRLSAVIPEINITDFDQNLKKVLTLCAKTPNLDHQKFFGCWADVLEKDPLHKKFVSYSQFTKYQHFADALNWQGIQKSLQDEFLQSGLKAFIISRSGLEYLLTNLRRWLLTHAWKKGLLKSKHIPFMEAMAENCFYGEYAMIFSDSEKQLADELKQKIEQQDKDFVPIEICLYAMYAPLFQLANADKIKSQFEEDKNLAPLIQLQISEPFEELRIKETITSIGRIEDDVSSKVQDMYEHNPYPRWKNVGINIHPAPEITGDVLVAGCGTCRPSTQLARKMPNINITAVDLSRSSLAFGMRRAAELDVQNVDYYHCDILDIEKLGRQFDMIECSGVLHHMKDPKAGWQKLINCLKPGGRMNIGLYSQLARTTITKAQKHAKESGFQPTREGIRAFRRHVLNELPDGHEIKPVSWQKDFYTLSDCRDLIFHVQEKCYTLPELKETLDELGLNFLTFRFRSPRLMREYTKSFPGDPDKNNLINWHKMEQNYPRMFIGMYQFICCRKGEEDMHNDFCESANKLGFLQGTG